MPAALEYVEDGGWDRVRLNTDRTAQALNPPVPQARVFNNAAITLTTATETTLTFNSERFNSGNLHSTSVNTGRLTVPITGLYMVGACVEFASNATGLRYVYLRLNGSTLIVGDSRGAVNGTTTVIPLQTVYQFTAADYVEVRAYQNSGGNLNATVDANYAPEFWMVRLAGYVNQGV